MRSLRVLASHFELAPGIIHHLAESCGNDFSDWVIALPTHRLGGLITAGLASKRDAIIPPEITTFEKLQSHIATELGFSEPRLKLSENQVRLILISAIAKTSQTSVAPSHLQELRVLMREMEELNIRKRAFERLKAYLRIQIHRDDQQVSRLLQRADDIAAVLDEFDRITDQCHGISPETYHRRELEYLAQALDDRRQDPRKKYLIAGLTSLTAAEVKIFPKLCDFLQADVWLLQPSSSSLHRPPVLDLIDALSLDHATQSPKPTSRISRIFAAELPDTVTETRAALDICTNRCLPDDADEIRFDGSCALLVADEATYRKTLNQLLPNLNIPYNLAIPTVVGETPVGIWLGSLFKAWRQSLTDNSLDPGLSFFTHPITAQVLAANSEQNPLPIQREMVDWFSAQRLHKRHWKSSLRRFKPDWIHQQPWLEVFESQNEHNDRMFWQIVTDLMLNIRGFIETSQGVDEILEQLKSMLGFISLSPQLGSPSMSEEILSQLLAAEIRSIGEPLTGLQVLNLSEARLYPFTSVIVLGSVESQLPRSRPRDQLLDDGMKRRMGLAGWQAFEALTEQNFFWLTEQVSQIYLLSPRSSAGQEMIRSRYVEQLLAFQRAKSWKFPLSSEQTPADRVSLERLARIGQHPPEMDIWSSRFSATSLKSLVSCPYRFLMSRFGIRSIDLSPYQDDLRVEGESLHEILRRFFADHQTPAAISWPSILTSQQQIYALMLERICWITDQVLDDSINESALRSQLKFHSWPKFCAFLVDELNIVRYPQDQIHAEIDIADFLGHSPCIRIGSFDYVIKGRLDLLMRDGRSFLIIDFKRSSIPSNAEICSGLEPQMSVYALALTQGAEPQPTGVIGGFFSITHASWSGRLKSGDPSEATAPLINRNTTDLIAASSGLGEILDWRRNEIVDPKIGFSPDASICELCEYAGVCRKNDPGMPEEWRPRMRLNERFGI